MELFFFLNFFIPVTNTSVPNIKIFVSSAVNVNANFTESDTPLIVIPTFFYFPTSKYIVDLSLVLHLNFFFVPFFHDGIYDAPLITF